ncbi:MAG TPA: M50 family metallopeptidase [Candidatus Saccharimonadia bacterium]|nr:M50 family metallopeptidase [Candidatus Saccharimonadia bacterium]
MLTIILVILLFASLVLVHEWGHFILARRNGVGVEEFGFGFPPKLYGRVRRGVLYSINLLPLGGFVRLKGEDAADRGPGTFGAARFGVQTKILLAGVAMNLLSAVVLLYGLCLTGLPGLGAPFEPSFLHPAYAQPKQLLAAEVSVGSPAAKAGLARGDYLLAVDSQALATDQALRDFTQAHAGHTVSLRVSHAGQERTITVKLRPPGTTDGFLGVAAQQVYKLRYDPLSALVAALYITGALFVATIVGVVQLIIHIPALILGLFSSSVPQAAEAASGPVGIVFILKSLSSLGASYIILFMANISVALAAFNVLPLPALDGGRLAVLAVQRLTKRTWSAEVEARYHGIGFMVLIGLMLLISVYDLRKYF